MCSLFIISFCLCFSAYKNTGQLQELFKKNLLESTGPTQSSVTTRREQAITAEQSRDSRRSEEDRDPLRVPGRGNRHPPPDWYVYLGLNYVCCSHSQFDRSKWAQIELAWFV